MGWLLPRLRAMWRWELTPPAVAALPCLCAPARRRFWIAVTQIGYTLLGAIFTAWRVSMRLGDGAEHGLGEWRGPARLDGRATEQAGGGSAQRLRPLNASRASR